MKILIFTTLLLASLSNVAQCRPPNKADASATKKYTLIALPYALDALEPAISRRTMELHYGRHLPAYVDNLNRLIEGTALEGEELESVVLRPRARCSIMRGRRSTTSSTSCSSRPMVVASRRENSDRR